MWWWMDCLAWKRSSVLPRFRWRPLADQLDLPPPAGPECGARHHKCASFKATTQMPGVALEVSNQVPEVACADSLSILALPQKLQQTRYTKHHTIKTLIFSLSREKESLMMFTEHSSKQSDYLVDNRCSKSDVGALSNLLRHTDNAIGNRYAMYTHCLEWK